MKIFVVGSGKLANAILSSAPSFDSCRVMAWKSDYFTLTERCILIHAGSGRQLKECMAFCRQTGSALIELSTGLETEHLEDTDFTLIVCPNTSILILKVLHLIRSAGKPLAEYDISIIESHQSSKTSAPGTAYNFAGALKFPVDKIRSIRDRATQLRELQIPATYLDQHAYHKIVIKDGMDEVTIETKVLGHTSYAAGVRKIVDAILNHSLEKRKYSVLELIEGNLI